MGVERKGTGFLGQQGLKREKNGSPEVGLIFQMFCFVIFVPRTNRLKARLLAQSATGSGDPQAPVTKQPHLPPAPALALTTHTTTQAPSGPAFLPPAHMCTPRTQNARPPATAPLLTRTDPARHGLGFLPPASHPLLPTSPRLTHLSVTAHTSPQAEYSLVHLM